VVGALVAAAVAAAGWVAAPALSGPDLAALSVDDVSLLDPTAEAQSQGAGGAEGVGAVLTRVVRFLVAAPALEQGDEPLQVEVLGLDGPGIVAADSPPGGLPLTLDPDGSIDTERPVTVDCGAIELPVDPAAYRLRVAVGAGGGQAAGVLPLGRVVEPWARAVEADCALAEAGRTARVVSVAGQVDPTRPIVDLRFMVENDGPHVVAAKAYGSIPGGSVEGGRSLELAPGTRREVAARVALDPCPSSGPRWGSGRREESWPAGVIVAVAAIFRDPDAGEFLGLDAAASRTLLGLLTEACAGLPTLAIDAPAAGVRYDPATRVLEGTVVVTPPAGWVGRLSVGPTPADEYGLNVEPLWQPSAFTALGQADPVAVPMRYRIPPGDALCGDLGLVVLVDVQVRVPAGAAERTARLQVETQIPWPAGVDSATLCLD
jgi:hypothetical protein